MAGLFMACYGAKKPPTYVDSTAITIPGVDSIDSIEVYNLANPVYNSGKWINSFATMDTMPVYSGNVLFTNKENYPDKVFIIFAKLNIEDSVSQFTEKYFEMNPQKYLNDVPPENDQYYAAQLEVKPKGYEYKAVKNFKFKNFNVFIYLEAIEMFENYPRDSILARHAYFKDVEVRLK
jgi:hypothetical protein